MDKKQIYESPDKGKTVYRRDFGQAERVKIPQQLDWIEELDKKDNLSH
jgi:hypothetical protein